jgi:hypothetical protein
MLALLNNRIVIDGGRHTLKFPESFELRSSALRSESDSGTVRKGKKAQRGNSSTSTGEPVEPPVLQISRSAVTDEGPSGNPS